MMMEELTAIRGLDPVVTMERQRPLPSGQRDGVGEFFELLKGAIEHVNHLQQEAGRLEDAIARGESMNIHQAIIAGEKAGLSFQLLMQVRNKLLEAYQEISRMQV
ncbi:MAG: flagellar hook-basal body complex protein FliE [Nitrospirae bacterium]|nr:MAG: flagellar hook-basal body complex protein FliE [Nitrospirota bacterium]